MQPPIELMTPVKSRSLCLKPNCISNITSAREHDMQRSFATISTPALFTLASISSFFATEFASWEYEKGSETWSTWGQALGRSFEAGYERAQEENLSLISFFGVKRNRGQGYTVMEPFLATDPLSSLSQEEVQKSIMTHTFCPGFFQLIWFGWTAGSWGWAQLLELQHQLEVRIGNREQTDQGRCRLSLSINEPACNESTGHRFQQDASRPARYRAARVDWVVAGFLWIP